MKNIENNYDFYLYRLKTSNNYLDITSNENLRVLIILVLTVTILNENMKTAKSFGLGVRTVGIQEQGFQHKNNVHNSKAFTRPGFKNLVTLLPMILDLNPIEIHSQNSESMSIKSFKNRQELKRIAIEESRNTTPKTTANLMKNNNKRFLIVIKTRANLLSINFLL